MLFAHIFTTLNRSMRLRACSRLFLPSRRSEWHTGPSQDTLKTRLIHYLFGEKKNNSLTPNTRHLTLHYNARSALYHGIRALGIGGGDEIILQAYTCVSVPNAIIATGARPVYCDIDATTLNIDPGNIISLITPQTKAILIQHTFGISADIQVIQKICTDHNLLLIEDVCHALGEQYQGQKLGTFGDIAIFSFGRDKIISSVNGGALLINNPRYQSYSHQYQSISKKIIIQNLLYIILGQLCKIIYHLGIGKLIYYIAGKYHLFPTIVTNDEKNCHYNDFDYAMPNCLADIALYELSNIDEYNNKRKHNSKLYDTLLKSHKGPTGLLRYLYLTEHPHQFCTQLKKHHIMTGDRYQQVIAPKGTDYKKAGYTIGSCPIAESIAAQSLNLPNHPQVTEKQISRIVKLIKWREHS